MISKRKSSGPRHPPPPESEIESIGGHYHPHLIEVQDFGSYALVLDVRSRTDYERDHIPGATHLELHETFADKGGAVVAREAGMREPLSPKIEALLSAVPRGRRVLLYWASGDARGWPLAGALRDRGVVLDVLPGGYDHYRRWVIGGVELLPKMISWRVLASPLGCESSRVLQCMQEDEHQVLDLQRLACWCIGSTRVACGQPHQEAFESAIVDALRDFTPQRPVWTSFVPRQLGSLRVPWELAHVISLSPLYRLEVPPAERLRHWRESEEGRPEERAAGLGEHADERLEAMLADELEPALEAQLSSVGQVRPRLPVLAVETFDAASLSRAIRVWLGDTWAQSSSAPE